MNYSQIFTALSRLLVVQEDDVNLLAVMPSAIAYAEDRIYRELDMLVANIRDSSSSTVASNRNFNLPTSIGTFIVVDGLNVVTPASTAPESGVRRPLVPVSRDFLDLCWPSTAGAGVPEYFAYISQDTYSASSQAQILLGPWPDNTYRIEVVGKIQPAAISATNANTYLSDTLPDLFIAACMVYLSGWQRNYGAQADDPRQSVSWDTQYKELRESAATWEARKRWAGASWSSKPIEPVAQPQRG